MFLFCFRLFFFFAFYISKFINKWHSLFIAICSCVYVNVLNVLNGIHARGYIVVVGIFVQSLLTFQTFMLKINARTHTHGCRLEHLHAKMFSLSLFHFLCSAIFVMKLCCESFAICVQRYTGLHVNHMMFKKERKQNERHKRRIQNDHHCAFRRLY